MERSAQLVKFQGDTIEAVREGADVWVSVRRVCDALALSHAGQRQRLQRSRWARTSIMDAPSQGGAQATFFVDLDTLPMWLATIDAGRVKPAIRPKLDAYQRECTRVLRDHFFGAAQQQQAPAPAPVIAAAVRDDAVLTRDLRRLVGACARQSGATERRIRGWLVKVSGAASYLRMPAAHGALLREQLMRVALGEDAAPWTRRALPPANVAQQVFPPPVGPARA